MRHLGVDINAFVCITPKSLGLLHLTNVAVAVVLIHIHLDKAIKALICPDPRLRGRWKLEGTQVVLCPFCASPLTVVGEKAGSVGVLDQIAHPFSYRCNDSP